MADIIQTNLTNLKIGKCWN